MGSLWFTAPERSEQRAIKGSVLSLPYRSIEDPAKLRRILEATLLVERSRASRPIPPRHRRGPFDDRCPIWGARSARRGPHRPHKFITAGLTADEEQKIGARPTGRGVLGLLIHEPEPLRVAQIGDHPDSFGFPPNHPPMSSFLGVPIKVRDQVYGNLYLTNKVGWSEFTTDDQALVGALALAAGIAIENAQLPRRVQEVAVYDERDRLARDLHDSVIQRLFAVGLRLQSMAGTATSPAQAERLAEAISDIDDTIREIRTTIFELGLNTGSRGPRAAVVALVEELRPLVGAEVSVTIDGPVDAALSDEIVEHLLPPSGRH